MLSAYSGEGGDGLEAYTIQVLDEPRQILVLQIRKNVPIFVPAKEAGELVVKLW